MKLHSLTFLSRKRFVVVLLSVCLALALLCGGVTYAWFALNMTVKNDGMELASYVSPNLLIALSPEELAALSTESETPFVSLSSDSDLALAPSSHYRDEEDGTRTPRIGLWYLSNTAEVDLKTGLADEPVILPVPTNHTEHFFIDYTVYLAAAEVDIPNATLTTTMQLVAKSEQDRFSYSSVSIDYYVDSVSEETFLGTLNVAGLDACINNANATCTSLTILDNGTMPSNHSSYIKVIMRCYFDGALLLRSGQTYVNTDLASAEQVSLKVNFDLTVDETATETETTAP